MIGALCWMHMRDTCTQTWMHSCCWWGWCCVCMYKLRRLRKWVISARILKPHNHLLYLVQCTFMHTKHTYTHSNGLLTLISLHSLHLCTGWYSFLKYVCVQTHAAFSTKAIFLLRSQSELGRSCELWCTVHITCMCTTEYSVLIKSIPKCVAGLAATKSGRTRSSFFSSSNFQLQLLLSIICMYLHVLVSAALHNHKNFPKCIIHLICFLSFQLSLSVYLSHACILRPPIHHYFGYSNKFEWKAEQIYGPIFCNRSLSLARSSYLFRFNSNFSHLSG